MNKPLSGFLIRHATSLNYSGVVVLCRRRCPDLIRIDWDSGVAFLDQEHRADLAGIIAPCVDDLAYEVAVHSVGGGDPVYSAVELAVGFMPVDDYAVREILELELASASPRPDIERLCRAALLGSDGARRKLAARARALFDVEVDGREIRST